MIDVLRRHRGGILDKILYMEPYLILGSTNRLCISNTILGA